jgi:uncharacterized protein (TIGR02284 family)
MSLATHDTATLNGLIAMTFDSVDGYAEARRESRDDRFVMLFNARTVERQAVIATLRDEMIRLGGTLDNNGTVLGGANRVFFNLRLVVTGRDEQAIIAEVEQGEDHVKAKFEYALADRELSSAVIHLIRVCYASIRNGHDQTRDLKLSMN